MPVTESLTLIERYGSFGLLALIVLAGLAGLAIVLRWVKNDLIPKASAYLDAREATCQEAVKTSAGAVAGLARNTKAVRRLAREVKKLKDNSQRPDGSDQ